MSTGGMLALKCNAAGSLGSFLGLVEGTDAIRYWDESVRGWADITGATPGEESADFNRNGFVGIEDFSILLAYFSSGVLPAAPTAEFVEATPEPGTRILLAGGLPFLLRRRRSCLATSSS